MKEMRVHCYTGITPLVRINNYASQCLILVFQLMTELVQILICHALMLTVASARAGTIIMVASSIMSASSSFM